MGRGPGEERRRMLIYLKMPVRFMAGRWRVWAPPALVSVVVFGVVIFLTKGKVIVPFLYRLF
jgi:hypothetical protein